MVAIRSSGAFGETPGFAEVVLSGKEWLLHPWEPQEAKEGGG